MLASWDAGKETVGGGTGLPYPAARASVVSSRGLTVVGEGTPG